MQIVTFIVSRVVSVLRRKVQGSIAVCQFRQRACTQAVPTASSGRLARADQVSRARGQLGDRTLGPQRPTERSRARLGRCRTAPPSLPDGPLRPSPTIGRSRSLPKACVSSASSHAPACRPQQARRGPGLGRSHSAESERSQRGAVSAPFPWPPAGPAPCFWRGAGTRPVGSRPRRLPAAHAITSAAACIAIKRDSQVSRPLQD
jgi:hypothetical protein